MVLANGIEKWCSEKLCELRVNLRGLSMTAFRICYYEF